MTKTRSEMREEMDEAYLRLFRTEDGKKVLADLLLRAGCFSQLPNDDRTFLQAKGAESLARELWIRAGRPADVIEEVLGKSTEIERLFDDDNSD